MISSLRTKSAARAVLVVGLAGTLSGCSGGNLASQLATTPEFNPDGQAKCSIQKSPTKPLIVEWPIAERATLEARSKRGTVAVRYNGCEMELLTRCKAPGKYVYTPTSTQQDRVTMRDEDELFANVPIGAAKLAAKLAKSGQLNVDMVIVGRYETDETGAIGAEQLTGSCAGATHVIVGFTTGAFELSAGAEAEVGGGAQLGNIGAGAKSSAKRQTLNRGGEAEACKKASTNDKRPPSGCGALLRIEVAPLSSTAAGAAPVTTGKPGETSNKSAPTGMVKLAAGRFSNIKGEKVTVAPFSLDKTEVTVAAYDACVQAGKCSARGTHPRYDKRSKPIPSELCNGGPIRRRKKSANHPMNCVLRSEAAAYCRFVGKRLPTSNEWEWAARSGKKRKYSWGNDEPHSGLLNACGTECDSGDMYHEDDGFALTALVGSFPSTELGLFDMGGNVAEWVEDPAGQPGAEYERYWGSHFASGYRDKVLGYRQRPLNGRGYLAGPGAHVGFRCAR